MKNLNVILVLIGILALCSCSNDDDSISVPSEVATAFQQKYPNAHTIEWELKSNNIYEVEFISPDTYESGDSNLDSYFKADGTWIYTSEEISYQNLPTTVQDAYSNSNYTPSNGWILDTTDIYYITLDNTITSYNGHNGPLYGLEVDHSTQDDRELRYDETGTLVSDNPDSVNDFDIIVSNLK
ncbi:hypothetical protein UJ101_00883 [Flavobacteriaceae bacterium UJ101]|nr:hypothetical protein UJ101_00883 [Flavobacteriaceae bacterium UJ101]